MLSLKCFTGDTSDQTFFLSTPKQDSQMISIAISVRSSLGQGFFWDSWSPQERPTKKSQCLQRTPLDSQDPVKHQSLRQMFSDKLSFLPVMPLGNVVLSRHAPLDVSQRGILHLKKFGYADIHKSGNSSEELDMIFSRISSVYKTKKISIQDSREWF